MCLHKVPDVDSNPLGLSFQDLVDVRFNYQVNNEYVGLISPKSKLKNRTKSNQTLFKLLLKFD
jgi:hypothetical protein